MKSSKMGALEDDVESESRGGWVANIYTFVSFSFDRDNLAGPSGPDHT